jgi:hypothetical protein
MPKKTDTKVVKEIIRRYGSVIDLKSRPYLIVEIIRQYGSRLGGPFADCLPPGGPPPGRFDPLQLVRELNARLADIARLSRMLEQAVRPKAGTRARRRTT